jgi:hypothetical protein
MARIRRTTSDTLPTWSPTRTSQHPVGHEVGESPRAPTEGRLSGPTIVAAAGGRHVALRPLDLRAWMCADWVMATSLPRPSRRTVLTASAATAVLALTGPTTQAAASPRRRVPAPETVDLPDGIRPEGITSGPGTTYYVGSLADGRIVTGDLLTGSTSVLLAGAQGRQLRGLYWDERTDLVWAAGNTSTDARVWAVDAGSGTVVPHSSTTSSRPATPSG